MWDEAGKVPVHYRVTPKHKDSIQAFLATSGMGGRLVVCNAEEDALPGIGLACGHNLIASSSSALVIRVAAA